MDQIVFFLNNKIGNFGNFLLENLIKLKKKIKLEFLVLWDVLKFLTIE